MKLVIINGLSFIAGYINALSVLCFAMPITHVTGTLTRISLSYINVGGYSVTGYMMIVCAYILGAMFSGKCFKTDLKNIAYVFLILAIIMVILTQLDYIPIIIVVILALVSGFQNALPLKVENSSIRTTHFSGTLTDIGVSLGKKGKLAFKNKLFITQCVSVLAFVIGGSSVLLLPNNTDVLFVICAILYTILSILLYYYEKRIQ